MNAIKLCLALLVINLAGCATIINGHTAPVTIATAPPGINVSISNSKGMPIANQKTPFTVVLKKGNGFFSGEKYKIEVEKPEGGIGTAYIETTVSASYMLGNLVFGGPLGWFIVDPSSGAMWSFKDDYYNFNLSSKEIPPDNTLEKYGVKTVEQCRSKLKLNVALRKSCINDVRAYFKNLYNSPDKLI